MTTIAAQLPSPRNIRTFLLVVFLAFLFFSLGVLFTRAWMASKMMGEVTVKPCATCPSCSCKPLLGGPRCGCPQ